MLAMIQRQRDRVTTVVADDALRLTRSCRTCRGCRADRLPRPGTGSTGSHRPAAPRIPVDVAWATSGASLLALQHHARRAGLCVESSSALSSNGLYAMTRVASMPQDADTMTWASRRRSAPRARPPRSRRRRQSGLHRAERRQASRRRPRGSSAYRPRRGRRPRPQRAEPPAKRRPVRAARRRCRSAASPVTALS